LIIGSMDSGSEKSFDVIAVASAISKLSSFLLECWNRIRFHSAEKAEKNIKTVSEGLDVIAKIEQNLEKRSIGEAEAARLKKVVLKYVNNLFNNGVYTPEMELIVVVKPKPVACRSAKNDSIYSQH
jgi:ABC-type cobalamin transport system ATPase subunit